MNVPAQANEVFKNFHEGLMYHRFASIEEMVRHALVGTSEHQRKAVAEFLDELLSTPRDEDELQRIWWRTSADIFFPDEHQLITFLKALQEAVDR